MHCEDFKQADILTGAMELLIYMWIQSKKKETTDFNLFLIIF